MTLSDLLTLDTSPTAPVVPCVECGRGFVPWHASVDTCDGCEGDMAEDYDDEQNNNGDDNDF